MVLAVKFRQFITYIRNGKQNKGKSLIQRGYNLNSTALSLPWGLYFPIIPFDASMIRIHAHAHTHTHACAHTVLEF